MASTITVRLVSPEREAFRGEAVSLVAPAWDGMVGILPNHAPFITLLGHGFLAIDLPGGGSRKYYVAGGALKVERNHLIILTEYAGEGPPASLPPEAIFRPEELQEG